MSRHVRVSHLYDELLFIHLLPSQLAERKSTKTSYMFGSECDLKMYVRNLGYPLRLQVEAQNHLFSTTSQLNGKFNPRVSKVVANLLTSAVFWRNFWSPRDTDRLPSTYFSNNLSHIWWDNNASPGAPLRHLAAYLPRWGKAILRVLDAYNDVTFSVLSLAIFLFW